MNMLDKINNSNEIARVAIDSDEPTKLNGMTPVTATPAAVGAGVAATGAIAGAAAAGAAIGEAVD